MANHIRKIAIVGATGHVGSHFVEELLKTGKHTITALTRAESKGEIPAGVQKVQVDYDDEQSLVSALQGQEFFIITLSVFVTPDTHSKLVKAAVKAGVPYIMPNSYGGDIMLQSFRDDPMYGSAIVKKTEEIAELGSSYIVMVCGFWYEWSLGIGEQWFGFDIPNRKVTFYDDGKTKITVSTWNQCGRALAALLSLPESGASPSVSDWKNKAFYLCSFKVCQRDMLDSLHRVLGTTDKDWQISYEPTEKRYKDGLEELKNGIGTGFAKAMYARVFFPNGGGDFEYRGLSNDLFGLPKEDLDEATKRTLDAVENGALASVVANIRSRQISSTRE